jgi:hypothetical protein
MFRKPLLVTTKKGASSGATTDGAAKSYETPNSWPFDLAPSDIL